LITELCIATEPQLQDVGVQTENAHLAKSVGVQTEDARLSKPVGDQAEDVHSTKPVETVPQLEAKVFPLFV